MGSEDTYRDGFVASSCMENPEPVLFGHLGLVHLWLVSSLSPLINDLTIPADPIMALAFLPISSSLCAFSFYLEVEYRKLTKYSGVYTNVHHESAISAALRLLPEDVASMFICFLLSYVRSPRPSYLIVSRPVFFSSLSSS